MSLLKFEGYSLPAAGFPKSNPLPDLGSLGDAHSAYSRSADMPDDVKVNPDYGNPVSILPYTIEDDYTREKSVRALDAAVLENDRLRAVFVPRLGGRLMSLYHKPSGRELLHRNPVWQPANLALRNAWFSGGIEWNISIIGHTPLTCSQLFTDKLDGGSLGPVLRMYEYERLRRAVYQMDFCLPDGSDFLFANISIVNTTDSAVPMYWWTNMAVDERPDVRVVVPAEKALQLSYETGLSFRKFPEVDGTDASYTTNLSRAMDFFFYIPPERRRFVSAIGGDGKGFIQCSTPELKGRKQFMWGTGAGGRHWQEYLAAKGSAYLEIQAGLGYSQMEYLEMPARGRYEWTEAFGPIEADGARISGDWGGAVGEAASALDAALPVARLNEVSSALRSLGAKRGEAVYNGSGWGALENERRARGGGEPLPKHLRFDSASITDEQKPWLGLLRGEGFHMPWPDEPPRSFEIGAEYRSRLEAFSENGGNAASWFELGVMRYNSRELDSAKDAWERSLALCESAWALRCLAMWEYRHGDAERAFELYGRAVLLAPSTRALAVEFGQICADKGKYSLFLSVLPKLSGSVKSDGRVLLTSARCLIETGALSEAEAILLSGVEAADIREGETTTTELWYRLQERRIAAAEGVAEDEALRVRVRKTLVPPPEIDFRMN